MFGKNRLFSIPYSSNIKTDDYLNLISNYKDNIENIYLGIPELNNHVSLQKTIEDKERTYDFLHKTNDLYKRIVVYNAISYNQDTDVVFKYFEDNIYPLIEKYNINGFVVTLLPLAIKLHNDFPKLELHTSCNCFQWNIRQMELWRNLAGVEIFNPPREAGRTPSMLKEMHKEGFKLKVLLNEACLYGCPYTINHACSVAESINTGVDCSCCDYANALRSNFVHPRWLDDLDEYVYCYKLSGREVNFYKMKSILDSYIHKKSFSYVNEITTYGRGNTISILEHEGIRIPESIIPDKLKYCECKECNKTCFLCSEIMNILHPM